MCVIRHQTLHCGHCVLLVPKGSKQEFLHLCTVGILSEQFIDCTLAMACSAVHVCNLFVLVEAWVVVGGVV